MANIISVLFSRIFCLLILTLCQWHNMAAEDQRKEYIVYMGASTTVSQDGQHMPASRHHLSMLQEVLVGSSVEESIIRHYTRSFNGFVARLTVAEKNKLSEKEGVVSIIPSRSYQLKTTRSWDFMKYSINVGRRHVAAESDVIIGVIDSGIWPESESFRDDGLGPIPKKWKGVCEGGQNFTCNKKLIGARYYASSNNKTTRDSIGHGTHTSSTVAGRIVNNASFYGIAQGKARGGVPSARIAAYSVCGGGGGDDNRCKNEDILGAFDDAIGDGVDLITISIGSSEPLELYQDVIAIGSFHAVERGILTAHSAGNEGPQSGSMVSVAPWLLTVAASSSDRRIVNRVVLGNGSVLTGYSINSFSLRHEKLPLVSGAEASRKFCDPETARICGCINDTLVKDKLLICETDLEFALLTGASGVVMQSSGYPDVSLVEPVPAAKLSTKDLDLILAYHNSTKHPLASLSKSRAVKTTPTVASFSSRGPNTVIPDILKPDISAPGVEILAAFSPLAHLTDYDGDSRSVHYSILSGTSFATPHAAGAAAHVKSIHPDWSPSAIKSALMTTAWPLISNASEFGFGSGHVDPVRAAHPGLVYETTAKDHINLLCGLGLDRAKVRAVTGCDVTCPEDGKDSRPRALNYPSVAAAVHGDKPFVLTFPRTVANVGSANATYHAVVEKVSRGGLTVRVVPSTLYFRKQREKKSFVVTVSGRKIEGSRALLSTSFAWKSEDGSRTVRSPIVVYPRTTLHKVGPGLRA